MPGYEFKRIQEGSDAGKYIFLIDGVLQNGAFTLDECMAKISVEDMPLPLENPEKNPCEPKCRYRSSICHAICPAHKAYIDFRTSQRKKRNSDNGAYLFTLEMVNKNRKRLKKNRFNTRKTRR